MFASWFYSFAAKTILVSGASKVNPMVEIG